MTISYQLKGSGVEGRQRTAAGTLERSGLSGNGVDGLSHYIQHINRTHMPSQGIIPGVNGYILNSTGGEVKPLFQTPYYTEFTHRSQIAQYALFFGGFDQYNKNMGAINSMRNRHGARPMTIGKKVKQLDYMVDKHAKRSTNQEATRISF